MKVAICLSGKYNRTNRIGDNTDFTIPAIHLYNNVIKPNNADVFIHGWDDDDDLTKKMLETYNPKKFIVEKQIEFDHPDYDFIKDGPYNTKDYLNRDYSRFYSFKKSVSLVDDSYDIVMWNRFDSVFYHKLNLRELDPSKFYITNNNRGILSRGGFADSYFISGYEIMKEYSLIYDRLDNYFDLKDDGATNEYYNFLKKHGVGKSGLQSMHYITRYRSVEMGLEDRLYLYGDEYKTYDLLRFMKPSLIKHGEHNIFVDKPRKL